MERPGQPNKNVKERKMLLEKAVYDALLNSTARETARYSLAGIHVKIENGTVTLEATDTFVLLQVITTTATAGTMDAIYSREDFAKTIVKKPTSRAPGSFDLSILAALTPIEGKYPNVAGIMPDPEKNIQPAVEAFRGGINTHGNVYNFRHLKQFIDLAEGQKEKTAYNSGPETAAMASWRRNENTTVTYLISPICSK
jgi:hypothetical protein